MNGNGDAKRAVLEDYMSRGPVLIQIDARACSGLPGALALEPMLVLRVGRGLSPNVVLEFGELGLNATVAFGDETAVIGIPWTALFTMLVEDDPWSRVMWFADAPKTEAPERAAAPIVTPPRARGKLRSV